LVEEKSNEGGSGKNRVPGKLERGDIQLGEFGISTVVLGWKRLPPAPTGHVRRPSGKGWGKGSGAFFKVGEKGVVSLGRSFGGEMASRTV